jgi:hypothetical protein
VTRTDGRPLARAPEVRGLTTRTPEHLGHLASTARIAVDLLGGDDAPDVVVDGALPGPFAEPEQDGYLASRRRAAREAICVATTQGVAS